MIKQYDLTIHNVSSKKQEVVLFGGMQLHGKPSTTDGIRDKAILIYGDELGSDAYKYFKEDYFKNPMTIISLVFSETIETEIHTEDREGRIYIRKVVCRKDKLYRKSDGLFILNPLTTMCFYLLPKHRLEIDIMAAVHSVPVKQL